MTEMFSLMVLGARSWGLPLDVLREFGLCLFQTLLAVAVLDLRPRGSSSASVVALLPLFCLSDPPLPLSCEDTSLDLGPSWIIQSYCHFSRSLT